MTELYKSQYISSEVYFSTLDLLQSIRNGDQHAFDQLLPHSDVCAMDHAAIHVAAQCNQKHMLNTLLSTLSDKILSPQSLVCAIANDNCDVVADLLPHLHEDCIAIGLKNAENTTIVDLIAPYITQVDDNLLLHLCNHNRMYSLNLLKDKINRKSIKKTLLHTFKSNNLPASIFLLDNCGDMFMNYDGNSNYNILVQAVSSSVEILDVVVQRCSKDMRYEALRRAVSFDMHEHSSSLIKNHTYTNEEAIGIFSICCSRSDSKFGAAMLQAYPVLQNHAVNLIGCAVRANDQELFNHLFSKVEKQNITHTEALYQAGMVASRKNYTHYLMDLAKIIDLNVALHLMSEKDNIKDEHMDGLRTVIAQQQNQTIASHIENLGSSTRRKM